MLAGLGVGQSIGGKARWTSLFGPRGLSQAQHGGLPVNRTAASIGLRDDQVGAAYRLTLVGTRSVVLTREGSRAAPKHRWRDRPSEPARAPCGCPGRC